MGKTKRKEDACCQCMVPYINKLTSLKVQLENKLMLTKNIQLKSYIYTCLFT